MNKQEGTYLTVTEVAKIMRVSNMTIYRLIHSGDLPAVRVGRSFRVLDSTVDAYLNSSEYEVSNWA